MWYSEGTVAVTNGGTNITGTGTSFLSNARVGDGITITGSTALHEIIGVTSNTQLSIRPAYAGSTGSGRTYGISPLLGYDKDLSDAFNQLRLQFGDQLSNLQPWALSDTAQLARTALGASESGDVIFTGTPEEGREALGLSAPVFKRVWSVANESQLSTLNAGVGDQASVSNIGLFDLTESGWVQQDAGNQRVTTSTGTQTVAEALDDRAMVADTVQSVVTDNFNAGQSVSVRGTSFVYDGTALLPDGHVNIRSFGDDAAAFQAAFDYCPEGTSFHYKEDGAFSFSEPLTIKRGTQLTLSRGLELTFSSEVGIQGGGERNGSVALTANISKGSNSFTCLGVPDFSVGDYVLFADEQSRTTNQPRNGEIRRITSIDGNVGTIEGTFWDSYVTTSSSFASRIDFSNGITINGGKLIGPGGTGLGSAVVIKYDNGTKVTNLASEGFANQGVQLNNCINFDVKHTNHRDMLNPSTAYAILCTDACQWGTVEKNRAENCGKLWDQGGLSSGYGLTRFVDVYRNTAQSCRRGGISTHETCEYISIDHNWFYDCANNSIFTRSVNTEVANNRIFNPELGAVVCSNRGQTGYLHVLNNRAQLYDTSVGTGIYYVYNQPNSPDTLTGSFDEISIEGNRGKSNSGMIAIGLENRIPGSLRNVSICMNNIRSLGTNGRGLYLYGNGGTILGAVANSNGFWVSGDYGMRFDCAFNNISETVISGNHTIGGDVGIESVGAASAPGRSFISGNVIRANVTGISGFPPEAIGDNRVIA